MRRLSTHISGVGGNDLPANSGCRDEVLFLATGIELMGFQAWSATYSDFAWDELGHAGPIRDANVVFV
jgi:hypothetical protein